MSDADRPSIEPEKHSKWLKAHLLFLYDYAGRGVLDWLIFTYSGKGVIGAVGCAIVSIAVHILGSGPWARDALIFAIAFAFVAISVVCVALLGALRRKYGTAPTVSAVVVATVLFGGGWWVGRITAPYKDRDAFLHSLRNSALARELDSRLAKSLLRVGAIQSSKRPKISVKIVEDGNHTNQAHEFGEWLDMEPFFDMEMIQPSGAGFPYIESLSAAKLEQGITIEEQSFLDCELLEYPHRFNGDCKLAGDALKEALKAASIDAKVKSDSERWNARGKRGWPDVRVDFGPNP